MVEVEGGTVHRGKRWWNGDIFEPDFHHIPPGYMVEAYRGI